MCVCVRERERGGGRYYVEQRVFIYNTFMNYMSWKGVITSCVKVILQHHHIGKILNDKFRAGQKKVSKCYILMKRHAGGFKYL